MGSVGLLGGGLSPDLRQHAVMAIRGVPDASWSAVRLAPAAPFTAHFTADAASSRTTDPCCSPVARRSTLMADRPRISLHSERLETLPVMTRGNHLRSGFLLLGGLVVEQLCSRRTHQCARSFQRLERNWGISGGADVESQPQRGVW